MKNYREEQKRLKSQFDAVVDRITRIKVDSVCWDRGAEEGFKQANKLKRETIVQRFAHLESEEIPMVYLDFYLRVNSYLESHAYCGETVRACVEAFAIDFDELLANLHLSQFPNNKYLETL